MTSRRCDLAVIGAGLVGLATAHALVSRRASVVVLEAEQGVAAHQSGRNSGVVHSGLYYAPGSLKARLCREGREALIHFCREHGVAHRICGKLVVATAPKERPRLDELERRGRANGLEGLARLAADAIREREPHAAGLDALWVPEAGVVDFRALAAALARSIRDRGGDLLAGARVIACRRDAERITLDTEVGSLECRALVACAGLQADRVALRCGLEPGVRIVPFRGDYRRLRATRADRVRGLVYPVPDPSLPFLGVHLTRRVEGTVEVGPNAVLSLGREAYAGGARARDLGEMVSWPGAWRLAARMWKLGFTEARRAFDASAFAREAARLIPGIEPRDLEPAPSGIRAMAVARDGRMLDDFHLVEGDRMLHVVNAPSPAATASLAIGRWIAERAAVRLGLSAS